MMAEVEAAMAELVNTAHMPTDDQVFAWRKLISKLYGAAHEAGYVAALTDRTLCGQLRTARPAPPLRGLSPETPNAAPPLGSGAQAAPTFGT